MSIPARKIEVKDFARRVERLCDFLIERTTEKERNGSRDLKIIADLKDEAADIQFDRVKFNSQTIDGLSDYMSGLGAVPEQEN